jgi:hypothetical protein
VGDILKREERFGSLREGKWEEMNRGEKIN